MKYTLRSKVYDVTSVFIYGPYMTSFSITKLIPEDI